MIDSTALREFVTATVKTKRRPAVVLDAAALRAVNGFASVPSKDRPFAVITPHAGEMARLVVADRRSIEAEPASFACDLAHQANVVVVLKGAVTVIAHPAGPAWQHVGHAIGLGTSGSGDVLAGVISGLAARGAALEQAAVWGVAIHALAGEVLTRRYGGPGLLAREIASELPAILNAIR